MLKCHIKYLFAYDSLVNLVFGCRFSFGPSTFAPSLGPYGGQGATAGGQQPQDPSQQGCGTPPAFCPKSQYRSYDGSCNNLRNPVLGTPNTPYNRLLPPKYGDGKYTMKR